jgi:hypothetical protein
MTDLDGLLREAGERWRATQPPPPAIDASRWGRRDSRWTTPIVGRALVTSLLVVGVVAAVAVTRLQPQREPDSRAGTPTGLVSPGASVTATGVIIVEPTGRAQLCLPNASRARNYEPGTEPPPSCSPIAVALRDLKVAELPDTTVREGTRFTPLVRVVGIWTDDALRVERVETGHPEPAVPPVVPCVAPDRGWAQGPDPVDLETAVHVLATKVSDRPDVYSGYWTVPLTGSPSSVAVVGTVKDPGTGEAELERFYPYALCVTRVEYSASDLQRVAGMIASADPTWQPEVIPQLNRVRVHLPVIDARAADILRQYPQAIGEPLVRNAS